MLSLILPMYTYNRTDRSYEMLKQDAKIQTDGVHYNDRVGPRDRPSDEKYSEAIKILKGKSVVLKWHSFQLPV